MNRGSELEQFADRVVEFTTRYNYRNYVSYGPGNLRGKTTVYPAYGDFPETYALREYGRWWQNSEVSYQKPYVENDVDPLGAEDFVTVHFNQPVLPTKVFIYETFSPGSVVRIRGRRNKGKWTLLWEGPPQRCPPEARRFQPQLRSVSCFVDTIRLELNCTELEHHACFDAVLLCGLPIPSSYFQSKCFQAFRRLQIAPVTTICDSSTSCYSSSEVPGENNFFEKLPNEIIIHIFKLLDIRSLSRCACVCTRWKKIAEHWSFYQYISLRRYWYVVDSRALDFLQKRCKNLKKLDLSWCGNDDESFSRKFYQFFLETCKNLTHLSLGNASYLNGSHLAALGSCPELVELRLRNVYISDPEFCHFKSLVKLTKLVTLDLYSTNITNSKLIPLLKVNPDLKYLNLDLCEDIENLDEVIEVVINYNKKLTGWTSWKARRLTSRGVGLLGRCHNLEDLDLGWGLYILAPEHALDEIANGCKNLRRLILSGWRPLSDPMLLPIIENCKKLEILDLMTITGVSQHLVERALTELPNLKLLELSFCASIPMQKVEQWRVQYPHVKIQKCFESN